MWSKANIGLVAFPSMAHQEMTVIDNSVSRADRQLILAALRGPRGHYNCERASQLSGIPARTLRDWRQSGVLIPDWSDNRPFGWSYRDIVYVRLLAWLRGLGMNRDEAARHVSSLRSDLAAAEIDPTVAADPSVRSDGIVFLIGQEQGDRLTGQQVFDALVPFLNVFELWSDRGLSGGTLGSELIRPSEPPTYPQRRAGEALYVKSASHKPIHALHTERGLRVGDIGKLYPQLDRKESKTPLRGGRLRGCTRSR